MNLLIVEMRRALHRPVVRVLILIALIGCVAAGIITFTASAGKSLAELHVDGAHPAVVRDWHIAGTGDGALAIASFFLLIGGLIGGATVAGAEWRAGTVMTLLTWEPRRVRLHLSRTAACVILAFLISLALQITFLASFLPAAFANGSTANLDADWWVAIAGAMARTSLLTAIAAGLGVALATLGRNTGFALVAIFTWITVFEGMIRGLKPGFARFLWGENATIILIWAQPENLGFRRGTVAALVTVTLYSAVITLVATLAFRRRDVASTS